jgi:hypothetical protein
MGSSQKIQNDGVCSLTHKIHAKPIMTFQPDF